MNRRTSPAALALLLGACVATPEAAPTGPFRCSYLVEYRPAGPAGAELSVEVELPGWAPGRWVWPRGPQEQSGREVLAWSGSGPPRALRAGTDGALVVPAGTRRLRYAHSLERLRGDMLSGLGSPGAHLLAGSAYLLRPEEVPLSTRGLLRFAGTPPLVPWRPDPEGRYPLDCGDLLNPGFHTFGARRLRSEVPGGQVEVALLPGELAASDAELLAWVRQAAAETATLAGGELPGRRVTVTLVPVPGRDASPFGQYLSSVPPSVALYAGQGAGPEALRRDWVLIHELCHALHPILSPDPPWLTEGITTWLQQLARMRSGRLSEAEGWGGLLRGSRAGRGETGGRSVRELSAGLGRWHAYRAVYWGGALLAVELDLELRRVSAGRVSLTGLLRGLRQESRVWSPGEVAARFDAVAGTGAFERLAAPHLDGLPFARLEPLLEALGVRPQGEEVALDEAAPRAAERRALLAGS